MRMALPRLGKGNQDGIPFLDLDGGRVGGTNGKRQTGTDEVRGSEGGGSHRTRISQRTREGRNRRPEKKGWGTEGKGGGRAGGSKVMIRGECHCKMEILLNTSNNWVEVHSLESGVSVPVRGMGYREYVFASGN